MNNGAQQYNISLLTNISEINILLPLDGFREILNIRFVHEIKNTVSWFLGVISAGGKIITINDLDGFFSQQRPIIDSGNRKILIVEYESELFGFAFHGSAKNIYYNPDNIQTNSETSIPPQLNSFVQGFVSTGYDSQHNAESNDAAVVSNCPLLDFTKLINDETFINIKNR